MTPSTKKKPPMVRAERRVTVRDYLIFVLKLFLDGMKDGLLITVSTVAVVVDLLSGGGRRPRLFYSVLRMSERFDLWLNLNGAVEKMDAGLDDDGLFGASEAGADTLLGKIEQMVRGGDEPRGRQRAAGESDEEVVGARPERRPAAAGGSERKGAEEGPEDPASRGP